MIEHRRSKKTSFLYRWRARAPKREGATPAGIDWGERNVRETGSVTGLCRDLLSATVVNPWKKRRDKHKQLEGVGKKKRSDWGKGSSLANRPSAARE